VALTKFRLSPLLSFHVPAGYLQTKISVDPGAAVKLLPCDHKGHGFKSWKQPLVEMQGNVAYIRPKMVGPLPGPCASGSYVHQAALFFKSHLFSELCTHDLHCTSCG
jgi:hypothetical protein